MTNEFKITVNYPAIEIKLLIDEDPQCAIKRVLGIDVDMASSEHHEIVTISSDSKKNYWMPKAE